MKTSESELGAVSFIGGVGPAGCPWGVAMGGPTGESSFGILLDGCADVLFFSGGFCVVTEAGAVTGNGAVLEFLLGV